MNQPVQQDKAAAMNPIRVKICGLTRAEDLATAVAAGVDAIGLVFYAKSKRCISIEAARDLVAGIPAFITVTGLFVDAEPAFVRQALEQVPLDLLQFHGQESGDYCRQFARPFIKAVRVQPGLDLLQYAAGFTGARGLLLDAFVDGIPGGTGHSFDWSLIPAGLPLPVILSGGLRPETVGEAIAAVRPYAVDVSSGVEVAPGIKDAGKIHAFLRRVRDAELSAA